MRDLTKSMFGFSLAMTLFGLEQLRTLLRDKQDDEPDREDLIRDDLDAMSDDTQKHFGDRAQKLYESGDKFQREMVDLVFDIFKAKNFKAEKVFDLAADVAEKSAEVLRDANKDEDEDTDNENNSAEAATQASA